MVGFMGLYRDELSGVFVPFSCAFDYRIVRKYSALLA
jgi:hypothetical protein